MSRPGSPVADGIASACNDGRARRRPPIGLVGLGALLCAGGTAWLVLLHHAAGAHERGEPPLLVHMLRDAATALPVVCLAVALAVAGSRRLARACGLRSTGGPAAAIDATAAALGSTAALAAGIPVHAWLFHVQEPHHQALAAHAFDDGGLALLATFPLALLATAIGRRHSLLGGARRRAHAARLAFAGAASVVLFGAGGWQVYADVQGAEALRDVIRPCFNDSPVAAPFAQPMPIPPLKQPDPGTANAYTVVEKRSEAEIIPGIKTPVWSYDGSVPGPTFMVDKSEIKDGSNPISVTFQNLLPPGDDPTGLIFDQPPSEEHHFRPSTTSVHLHGINGDHFSDGYADDGDGHRHLADPGTQFTHIYPNNEYQRPATLWYHDHSIHITSEHIYRGLAGMYIVQDSKEKALPLPRGYGVHDIPLILKDVMIAPQPMKSDFPGAPDEPLPRGTLIYNNCSHMGAFGDVMTVNGKQQPKFDVGARKYRFRLLDGSDARQYMLALRTVGNLDRPADDPGANEPFTVIGTDEGLLRNPEPAKIAAAEPGSTSPTNTSKMLDAIHVAPAERMEFVVDFKRYAGQRLVLVNLLAEPSERKLFPLMAFDVDRADVADESSVPPVLRPDADPSDPWPSEHEADVQEPTRIRHFEFSKSNGPYWSINGQIFDPLRADAKPALNTTERWVLENPAGGWGHPVHIHLGRFRIRKIEGRAPRPGELQGWKDVVWLGPNQKITVDHEFWNFNGRFVFHCHNGSHEDFDMMSQFEVQPPLPPPAAGDPEVRPIGSG